VCGNNKHELRSSAAALLGVPRTATEDQVVLRKVEMLNGQWVEHKVLTKSLLNSRQPLHRGGADVSARNSFGKQ